MKLKEFKKLICKAEKFAKTTDPDIYFVFGNKEFEVKTVKQFFIIPDVYVHLKLTHASVGKGELK